MVQSLFWKFDSRSASQEIPLLFLNLGFISVFTTAHRWTLSWGTWIQSTSSHSISGRSILILSSHLRLGLPSCVFHSGFPTNTLVYISQLFYSWPIPCRSHIPWFHQSNSIWCIVQVWSSSLCSFLHPSSTFSLLGANIIHSTLFSNTLSLFSFFRVGDQVSHPYKTCKTKVKWASLVLKLRGQVTVSVECVPQAGKHLSVSLLQMRCGEGGDRIKASSRPTTSWVDLWIAALKKWERTF
jgi:hypothetical protein